MEFIYPTRHGPSMFTMRELDTSCEGFEQGLLEVRRQHATGVIIGEIRGAESAEKCLRFALIGLLVVATIHGENVPSTLHSYVAELPTRAGRLGPGESRRRLPHGRGPAPDPQSGDRRPRRRPRDDVQHQLRGQAPRHRRQYPRGPSRAAAPGHPEPPRRRHADLRGQHQPRRQRGRCCPTNSGRRPTPYDPAMRSTWRSAAPSPRIQRTRSVPLARRFAKRPLIAVTIYKDGIEAAAGHLHRRRCPTFGEAQTCPTGGEDVDADFLRAFAERHKAKDCLINLGHGLHGRPLVPDPPAGERRGGDPPDAGQSRAAARRAAAAGLPAFAGLPSDPQFRRGLRPQGERDQRGGRAGRQGRSSGSPGCTAACPACSSYLLGNFWSRGRARRRSCSSSTAPRSLPAGRRRCPGPAAFRRRTQGGGAQPGHRGAGRQAQGRAAR